MTDINAPKPGSREAVALGCRCPVFDSHFGRGYDGERFGWVFNAECDVHAGTDIRPLGQERRVTDNEAGALGRRWMAACGKRTPGMLLMSGARVVDIRDRDGSWAAFRWEDNAAYSVDPDDAPDFRDGATRGAAMAELYELMGHSSCYPLHGGDGRPYAFNLCCPTYIVASSPTEAEAIVVAREAAKP